MAAEHIMLIDDRRSGVALPEVPLLGVLPGTGGLTRLTDKRLVRRDRADVFCTTEEGVRGAARWSGGWSTKWCRPPLGKRSCASARWLSRRVRPAARMRRASR